MQALRIRAWNRLLIYASQNASVFVLLFVFIMVCVWVGWLEMYSVQCDSLLLTSHFDGPAILRQLWLLSLSRVLPDRGAISCPAPPTVKIPQTRIQTNPNDEVHAF